MSNSHIILKIVINKYYYLIGLPIIEINPLSNKSKTEVFAPCPHNCFISNSRSVSVVYPNKL